MKKYLLTVASLLVLAATSAFAEAKWLTDYDKALEQAGKENKLVLLDFTGSDWCGWCVKLNKEVFDKKEFKEYAAKNLVLVEIDFPKSKHQSPAVKKQNEYLQGKYQVEGFPTIYLVDSKGTKVAQGGYMEGGPEAFIKWIAQYRK